MRRTFITPATLKAVAEILSDMAENAIPVGCGCEDFDEFDDFDGFDEFDEFIPTPAQFKPCNCGCANAPLPRWGVTGFPPEDKNKRFGIHVGNVDYPTRDKFASRAEWLNACAAYDRLVDAVEDVNWESASDSTPLHRVNCIRRDLRQGPPMGINLIGENGPFQPW